MKKKEKKKSSFAVLMHYAGGHKYYSYASAVLAVISAWIALIPFYDVWRIIKEILRVRPDFSKAENISRYGWEAVGFALLGMVFYIAALMCSHKAAFRVQASMRVSMMKHIMKLPLGYVEAEGTGKIRKIVMDSSTSTETYLAHNFPDKAVSMATPVGLLVMMFIFDWRLGLISLIPAFIAFVLMGTLMMGPKMAEDMKQYQNALEKMSSEAVEYVRGIPVVKTFGQTIFSFKRFKLAIDEYEKWTLGYTKNMMLPMICFTTAANGIFAALIIAAFKLTSHGVTDEFVLNLFFYVIITSILTVTQANMRVSMMKHIMKLPLGYVEAEGTGKIRKIVMDSSTSTETYLAHNFPDKAVSMATPVGLLVMMFIFDWRLGLISLIPAFIAFVLMGTLMMGPKMAEDMKQYQNALEKMSSEAVEYVRGIPVVKTFGQTIFSFKRFKLAIDEYEKWTLGYTKNMMLPMICFTTAANGIFAALIIAAFKLTSHGVTDEFVLNLFFYVIITSILTVTLMKIAYAGESQMLVDDAVNRMYSILETEPLAETKSGETPKDSSIQLDNAVFAYDNAESNAVDGITMNIKAGEHIAVVGPSGGGKTTLCSLIARFWDVKSGSIKIGGADVRNIPSEELMKYVSYVFQDSKLLKMSILDNVRMGRPDATDDAVMQALRDAQCMDIIEKFPEGVDTMIGSKGIYVSGGECQRLSIARAFLKNAPVLILDEATAFADPDNERSVQQAFERLSKDKTVIMIAHRLSTVTNADRIYVLSEGRIAESGKHEELIEQGGIYSRMWNEYNRSVSWQVRKAGV